MDDYGSVIAPGTLRLERVLPGPIERVWRHLTDSETRGRWLASGEMELRVGGRVEHVFRNASLTSPHDDPPPPKFAQGAAEHRMTGRVTACEPPRLLGYTWWDDGTGEASEVGFELTPRAHAVLLVLTHRRLAARDDMVSVAAGWHAHLGVLADRLEGRAPTAFWATFARTQAEYERRIPATA